MEVRYSPDPQSFARMSTAEIRSSFVIDSLFAPDTVQMVYSDHDQAIVGSAVPGRHPHRPPLAVKLCDLAIVPGEIEHELGDVLWYAAALASDLDASLDEVAEGNLQKLAARAENGTIKGDRRE